jgi:hypothetical protein
MLIFAFQLLSLPGQDATKVEEKEAISAFVLAQCIENITSTRPTKMKKSSQLFAPFDLVAIFLHKTHCIRRAIWAPMPEIFHPQMVRDG